MCVDLVHPGRERLIKKGRMVYLQNYFVSNNNILIDPIITYVNEKLNFISYRINKLTSCNIILSIDYIIIH